MQDWPKLAVELKKAWDALPPGERTRIEPKIRESHHALLSIRAGVVPPSPPKPELALAYSLLHDDPDGLLIDSAAGAMTSVGPDGQVYFGGVDYDSTDPGWSYCPIAWELTAGESPRFSNTPATLAIANTVTIGLLGDWGGNNAAAQQVASSARDTIGAGA